MSDGEYPKAIYRDGGSELVWGELIETASVASREEEKEALSHGWRLHPLHTDTPATKRATGPRRR